MFDVRKCFKTVEPKEPVPPVMTRVLSLKTSMICIVSVSSLFSSIVERILYLILLNSIITLRFP